MSHLILQFTIKKQVKSVSSKYENVPNIAKH